MRSNVAAAASVLLLMLVSSLHSAARAAEAAPRQSQHAKELPADLGGKHVVTDEFEIHLPGVGTEAHEPTHYAFQDDSRGEQVTISVAVPRAPLADADIVSTVRELGELRKKAIGEMSGPTAEFGRVRSTSTPGAAELEFSGTDTKNGVQFAVVIKGRRMRVVAASYFKYAPLLRGDEFTVRAKEILGTLKVR